MRFLSVILLGLILSTSCNKVKQNAKKLDGTWTIYSYAVSENGGFITYQETIGTITFLTQDDGTFTYQENYTRYTGTDTIVSTRSGSGFIKGKNANEYDLSITAPTAVTLKDCNIHLVTKDDLKITNRELTGGHTIVLQKN